MTVQGGPDVGEPWVRRRKNPIPLCRRPACTLSEVEGEALRKNAFCFVAPRFALCYSLRQRGMEIFLS